MTAYSAGDLALVRAALIAKCSVCGDVTYCLDHVIEADAVLAALAEAGRLVPDGAEFGEEWHVRIVWPGEDDDADAGYSVARDEAHARTMAAQNWPTAKKTLLHRAVITGAWVEADGTE